MFVKIIRTYRDVVAVCDSELLGKKFEDAKFQIDVKESFYKGEEMDESKTEEIMINMSAEDATFNIVGKKAVALALKARIISKEAVKTIQGIPLVLVLV